MIPLKWMIYANQVVGSFVTTKMMQSKSAAKAACNDKTKHRIAVTSSAMAQLDKIKATGLSSVVSTHIQEVHNAEMQSSLYARRLRVASRVMGKCCTRS